MATNESPDITPRQLRKAYVGLLMNVSVDASKRTLREAQSVHIRLVYCAFAFLYASPVLGFTPLYLGAHKAIGLTIFAVCVVCYFAIMMLSSARYTRQYQYAVRTLECDPEAMRLVEEYSRH